MDLLSAAVLLLIIMDPFGNIPVFHAVLNGMPAARRPWIIAREMLFAYLVLLGFLLAGEPLLGWLGLSQPSLSIAGGVILFLIALGMVFPRGGLHTELPGEEPFIVPLAVPMVAGPSAIAVLLLLVSREPERLAEWVLVLTVAWCATALVLVGSSFLLERLGRRALRAMEKLMGMLLIMMAVQMLLDGAAVWLAEQV
jgi:multiple antibiotic resistance protein